MTIEELKYLAVYIDEDTSECKECIFNEVSCCGCDCAVGNVLKRLVDEGHLTLESGK